MRRIIALMAMVACGLGLFLYPQANRWYGLRSDYATTYAADQAAHRQTPLANHAILAAAQEYNARLNQQPFAVYSAADALLDPDYLSQLRSSESQSAALPSTGADVERAASQAPEVPGSSLAPLTAADAMARVSIPKIDVTLPVYHGTAESALMMGAGHIYGTSLPVGGPGTHTVITAHSRQGQNNRFTRIRELGVGDEFLITTAGQTMRYVIDQIKIVLPTEVDDLQIVPGQDLATLLTCTPLGLNTHRLLVRGSRADLPNTSGTMPDPAPLPFPWWAVWLGVGVVSAGLVGRVIDQKMTPATAIAATGVGKRGPSGKRGTGGKGGTGGQRGAGGKPAPKQSAKPAAPRTGHGRHVARAGRTR